MLVRSVREDELASLLKLYEIFRLRRPEDPSLSSEGQREREVWSNICANLWLRYYAAEVDGALVSTCTLTIIPNLLHPQHPYSLIENVVTDPLHRRRGYATAVLQFALNEAWREGSYKVMLLTGSKEESTLRFYVNSGFTRGVKTGFVAYATPGGN